MGRMTDGIPSEIGCVAGSRVRLLRLREVREGYFITQGDLAEKAGVTRSTIIDLEKGRTEAQYRTVRKLADVLGVSPQELVGTPVEYSIRADRAPRRRRK